MERENRYLEYKESISNTFLKTVSAYANYYGGKIIFGVTNDLKEVRIENPLEACIKIESKINDSIKPNPTYKLEINKKNNTIELEVFSGMDKPYFYNNKAYKRNDSSTIEVDTIELKRLIMEGNNTTFDSQPSNNQNLRFDSLERELKRELKLSEFNMDIMKTLQLYRDGGGYNNAAELLSDNNGFSSVECIRFRKNENEIVNRKEYGGSSIIDQFNNCMEMYSQYYVIETINGKTRERIELIPEVAFREAIANAIIHRTYDINSTIKVKMFDENIEIISPGSLTSGISEEDYREGKFSVLRNPIIGEIFYRLRYIEKLGTGIKRINNAYKKEALKPEYEVSDNYISVKLPIINTITNINDTEKEVFSILESGKKLTRAEIEEYTKLGKDKTIRVLNSLLSKNVITRDGKGRDTKYEVKKK